MTHLIQKKARYLLVINNLIIFGQFFYEKTYKILTSFFVNYISKNFFLQSVPHDITDNELAEMAKEDEDHFSELYNRYFDKVYKFFFFRLRAHEDAEDLCSELFEKIFKKLHLFHNSGKPFSAWLFTIAHNVLIDFVRKQKLKTDPIHELLPAQEPSEDFDLTTMDQTILEEKLWKTIAILPKKQQEIWNLKLTKDLSHKEIAEIIKTTENNINVHIYRSIETLKKYLCPQR